jgi:cytochrome c oxidase subunit IV
MMELSKEKIDPIGLYVLIYFILLLLLVATLSAASFDLGPWNIIVALAIGVIKALLVLLFFMHIRHSSRLTWIFAGAAFLWLTLLLGLTLSEYFFRSSHYPTQSTAPYAQNADH